MRVIIALCSDLRRGRGGEGIFDKKARYIVRYFILQTIHHHHQSNQSSEYHHQSKQSINQGNQALVKSISSRRKQGNKGKEASSVIKKFCVCRQNIRPLSH
jgi:ribosomal protein S14